MGVASMLVAVDQLLEAHAMLCTQSGLWVHEGNWFYIFVPCGLDDGVMSKGKGRHPGWLHGLVHVAELHFA